MLVAALLPLSCSKFDDKLATECNAGAEIVFLSRRGADWQLHIMDYDGGNQRVLTDKIMKCGVTPVCSNDGSMIAFTVYEDQQYRLYVVDRTGLNPTLLSASDGSVGEPAFSPDDTKIAFSKQEDPADHCRNIYTVNTDGSNEMKITEEGCNCSPSWFPSGNKIAFASCHNYFLCGIYSINTDGSGKKLLTPQDESYCGPVVSPDGKRIACVSNGWEGSQIFAMNSDGTNLNQLTFTVSPEKYFDTGFPRQGNEDPAWSPDSRRIAYVSWEDGDPDIVTIAWNGGSKKRLTNTSSGEYAPYWSADGEFIVFTSVRDQEMDAEIFIMKSNGAEETALTRHEGSDTCPVWLK